jgi:hypothetical protein
LLISTRVMLKALVNKLSIHNGLQSVLYNPTHPYTTIHEKDAG